MASIPFAGCKSDGQLGPKPAPQGNALKALLNSQSAAQLAYYKAQDGFGTLAPRGWHCFGVYGSDGATLYVSPEPIDGKKLLSADGVGITGPAVQISLWNGGTSGRFQVAKIIARVFPAHKAFADAVIAEGIEPASSFPQGPYPADKLAYKSSEAVEYDTPAQADGLGSKTRLGKGPLPISGVAALFGKEPDLMLLALRLPPGLAGLGPTIVAQSEREVRKAH